MAEGPNTQQPHTHYQAFSFAQRMVICLLIALKIKLRL